MKARVKLELKEVRDVKDNKSISRYISSKKRTKEIVALLLNGTEHQWHRVQKRVHQCHDCWYGVVLELPDPYGE